MANKQLAKFRRVAGEWDDLTPEEQQKITQGIIQARLRPAGEKCIMP